ncbi:hypothetical protein [Amycolatopsis jejuensis]|uniref:hypothetical protein n=1 Tax=Amycolatopsis jejuensis TaxID=330084 RepID=UPI000525F3BC|nr:hypothetical protein [Amycolatopsis jejuensis]
MRADQSGRTTGTSALLTAICAGPGAAAAARGYRAAVGSPPPGDLPGTDHLDPAGADPRRSPPSEMGV